MLLADAVLHAVDGEDRPVTAAVAERAAAHALAEHDPLAAATLLGVAAARRGACDVGDPEVRATLDEVRTALGSDATLDHVRALPRADVIALLQDYVRGLDAGSVPAAGSDSTPAAASDLSLDSASATSRA